jgi:hypothetical protein
VSINHKNATADMISGIAGTVNLRTHVPFDPSFRGRSGELGYSNGPAKPQFDADPSADTGLGVRTHGECRVFASDLESQGRAGPALLPGSGR